MLVSLCVLTPSQMSSNILHPTSVCKLCLMSEYTGIHLYLPGEILKKKPLTNSEKRGCFCSSVKPEDGSRCFVSCFSDCWMFVELCVC